MSTHLLENTIETLSEAGKTPEEIIAFLLKKEIFSAYHDLIHDFQALEIPDTKILNSLTKTKEKEGYVNPVDRETNLELATFFLEEKAKVSNSTAKTYRNPILTYIEFLGDTHLFDATYDQASAFLDQIKQQKTKTGKPLKPKTINLYRSAVSCFTEFLIESGRNKMGSNYFSVIPSELDLSEDEDKPFFTTEDCQKVYQAIEEMRLSRLSRARTRFLFSLLLETGMRRGQARILKLGDLDFDLGIYTFYNQKTKKKCQANLSPLLMSQYRAYMKVRNEILTKNEKTCDYLFINGHGEHMGDRWFAEDLKRAYLKAGVVDLESLDQTACHILRHSFVELSQQEGIPLAKVSKFLGHTNIQTTTKFYVHSKMEKEDSEKIESFGLKALPEGYQIRED